MRETKKSLKVYFIIAGVLGILSSVGPLVTNVDIFIRGIDIVISAMFIFYGVKFYDYLQTSPKTLINFIIISLGIRTVLGLLLGQLGVILLILLGWYLTHNIKKLSTQSGDKLVPTNP